MTKKFYFNFLILITISMLVIFISCAKEDTDAPSDVPGDAPAVEETAVADMDDISMVAQSLREEFPDITQRAEEVVSGIMSSGGRARVTGQSKDDAWVYVYIAATYEEQTPLVASLYSMTNSFTAREEMTNRNELLDERYIQTVMHHMQSDDNIILTYAIGATEPPIAAPDASEVVLEQLIDFATNHPDNAVRYDALDVLEKSWNSHEHADRIQAFVDNLDSEEPYLVSKALLRMPRSARNASDRDALQKKLLELLQHEDGGVRGRAIAVLGRLVTSRSDDRDEVAKQIIPLMDDENTFARSETFSALQSLDYRPAIHLIMNHLQDNAEVRHEIEFTRLDGRAGRATHGHGTVGEAALNSLRGWSNTLGERFTFSIRNPTREEDLANAIQLSRQWYASIKDEIPQP